MFETQGSASQGTTRPQALPHCPVLQGGVAGGPGLDPDPVPLESMAGHLRADGRKCHLHSLPRILPLQNQWFTMEIETARHRHRRTRAMCRPRISNPVTAASCEANSPSLHTSHPNMRPCQSERTHRGRRARLLPRLFATVARSGRSLRARRAGPRMALQQTRVRALRAFPHPPALVACEHQKGSAAESTLGWRGRQAHCPTLRALGGGLPPPPPPLRSL